MAAPMVDVDPVIQTVEHARSLILEEKARLFDELVHNGLITKTNYLIELEAKLESLERGDREIVEASGSSSSNEVLVKWMKEQLEKRHGLKKLGKVAKLFQIEHDDAEVYTILSEDPVGNFGFQEVDSDFDPSVIAQEYDLFADLPKSIKVVTWTGKPNLFQALILGPNNSVYEDGLFVFSILIPKNYPNELPKVRHFYSNVAIGGEMEGGGLLKESFIQRLWNVESSIVGICRGIQHEKGFFENEEGSRTHCRRIWSSIYEIISCPPPHFKNVIMSHFIRRLPYLETQMHIDLAQKQLTQGEKDLVKYYWGYICSMLLGKESGEGSKGKKKKKKSFKFSRLMKFKWFAKN